MSAVISVIVRSMDGPTLAEALDSLFAHPAELFRVRSPLDS